MWVAPVRPGPYVKNKSFFAFVLKQRVWTHCHSLFTACYPWFIKSPSQPSEDYFRKDLCLLSIRALHKFFFFFFAATTRTVLHESITFHLPYRNVLKCLVYWWVTICFLLFRGIQLLKMPLLSQYVSQRRENNYIFSVHLLQ